MTRAALVCASIFALLTAASLAPAGERIAQQTRVLRDTASRPNSSEGDCWSRIWKLDASNAEGNELLAEKDEVIGVCAGQYAHDGTIKRLVRECRKFEEQPIVKQQSLAECELAAFRYANALRTLKEQYKK